jgi:hypothetical protein
MMVRLRLEFQGLRSRTFQFEQNLPLLTLSSLVKLCSDPGHRLRQSQSDRLQWSGRAVGAMGS